MNSSPLVSVVVPTCNRPEYLRLALESVLAQSYGRVEVLVCDDSDSDASERVVHGLDDHRITYRRNRPRLGMGPNKLSALRAAQGKYVANLDDDDLWETEFLARLVPPLEADPSLVLAFSDHFVIGETGEIDEAKTEAVERRYRGGLAGGRHQPFCRIGLVRLSVPMAMATLLRRDAVPFEDLPPGADVTGDLWLTYLACRTGLGAYYVQERLTRYRVHSGSSTTLGGINWHRSSTACYERFLLDRSLATLHGHFRRQLALSYADLGFSFLRAGDAGAARKAFRTALSHRFGGRAALGVLMSILPGAFQRRLPSRRTLVK